MKKRISIIRIIVSLIVFFFALRFENAMSDRQNLLIFLFSIFILSSISKLFIKNIIFSTTLIAIDTILIFFMEQLSRYIVNYSFHILFLLVIVEAALILDIKKFKIAGPLIGFVSLIKYGNNLVLNRNFSTITESILVTLFTIITIISLYLTKIIYNQKNEVEVLYKELKFAHQDLADKYDQLDLKFEYDPMVEELTDRELEISKLVAEGLSNNEIGEKLFISEGTVKNHITNIFRKLDIRDRTQLAIFVIKNRLQ
ncbi:MAG: response regulator transcription factor [Clostridia bacterium]